MYLRTPKRYQKQTRHVFSLRWLWLWILTPMVTLSGMYLYENRAELAPPIQQAIEDAARNLQGGVATMTAPTPFPTENPVTQLTQANNAWEQGSIDEAITHYESVVPNVPNDVQAHYRLAFGLVMQGRYDEALEAAEQTINANPFNADAWAIRSQALNSLGRQGEAIASAMQALQLDPDSARATAFLAEAYFDSNQVERALSTVEDALELDPDSYEALYVYSRVQYEAFFDNDAALDAITRAYDIAPNMPYLGIQKAILLLDPEAPDPGYEILQQIVEMNPENSTALFLMANYAYSGFGDANQAIDQLTRCIAANPQSISCNYYMGRVKWLTGDGEGAREPYERAVELGSTDPRHYLSAGRVNIALNNCARGLPYLRDGYQLEQETPFPDAALLTEFEEAMASCGEAAVPGLPVPPTLAPELEATEAVEGDDANA